MYQKVNLIQMFICGQSMPVRLLRNILLGKRSRSRNKGRGDKSFPLFHMFAQHERTLTGASPQTALIVGRLQPKARVSIVRWNLKEAGGKRLAR